MDVRAYAGPMNKVQKILVSVIVGFAVLYGAFQVFVPTPFERAEAMFTRGEYVSALRIYLELAEEGDPRGMYAAANIYEAGLGPNIFDPDRAQTLLIRAATFGYGPAQYRLGMNYYNGTGFPVDLEQAEIYLGGASDNNIFAAWDTLVTLYPIGPGADRGARKLTLQIANRARLLEYAQAEQPFAMVLSGLFLEDAGRPDDALLWYQRAVRTNGSAIGAYYLGRLLAWQGQAEAALEPLMAAAEQDLRAAQALLALTRGGLGLLDKETLMWAELGRRDPANRSDEMAALVEMLVDHLGDDVAEDARDDAQEFEPENPREVAVTDRGINRSL